MLRGIPHAIGLGVGCTYWGQLFPYSLDDMANDAGRYLLGCGDAGPNRQEAERWRRAAAANNETARLAADVLRGTEAE